MAKVTEITTDPHMRTNVKLVKLSSLILFVTAFALGMLTAFFISNALSKQQINISTYSLISFVFTVALGAASVILAILSISLGRQAEDALIRRSDEGIRSQNEVFVRTSEVLSKIQASTGVTEKRIEDIIAGRTSSIAREVVERSLPESQTLVSKEFASRLKNEIAESLRTEIIPLIRSTPSSAQEYLSNLALKQELRSSINIRWERFRDALVSVLSKLPGVQVISEGQGDLKADNSTDFWDALITINNLRIGVDVHIAEQVLGGVYEFTSDSKERRDYVKQMIRRIREDSINLAFIVFDTDVWSGSLRDLANILAELNSQMTDSRFITVFGDPYVVTHKIKVAAERFTSESKHLVVP